jgi:hypothetical protein
MANPADSTTTNGSQNQQPPQAYRERQDQSGTYRSAGGTLPSTRFATPVQAPQIYPKPARAVNLTGPGSASPAIQP